MLDSGSPLSTLKRQRRLFFFAPPPRRRITPSAFFNFLEGIRVSRLSSRHKGHRRASSRSSPPLTGKIIMQIFRGRPIDFSALRARPRDAPDGEINPTTSKRSSHSILTSDGYIQPARNFRADCTAFRGNLAITDAPRCSRGLLTNRFPPLSLHHSQFNGFSCSTFTL